MTFIQEMLEAEPVKIILSNKADKTYKYKRAEVKHVAVGGKTCYQISEYTDTQVFQTNLDAEKLCIYIEETFPEKLCQINCFTETEERSYKMTKKGKLLSQVKKLPGVQKSVAGREMSEAQVGYASEGYENAGSRNLNNVTEDVSHNRKKNYIIQEGEVIPPLVDMGIFTKDGKIVRTMYDKFRQINRFVEIVDDVISKHNGDEIYIIDFGCGKSYLTFILYYYLVHIKGMKAHITGLDLKADVIKKCNEAAKRYGYDGLRFELGDINGYKSDTRVDMVVTLHACDTATDYALYNAVNWNARYILSVPCCQKELNRTIDCDLLRPMMNYGIIKERMAALATDAIRGNMLTYRGYKTQIMEFVDMAHSPKNLLIRAVKSNIPTSKRESAILEVEQMCEGLKARPVIYGLLK